MRILLLLLICLPVMSPAYAQSADTGGSVNSYAADTVVISAQGYPRPLTSTTGGIAVMNGDEIMKRNPDSVSDALTDITGIYKISDSSWGSELSIRGTSRDKVVMIIDGCRVNTATDIGAQFGMLNPASVERVEVLKGPVSSIYGSGSIGGVVNIYTRTGSFSEITGIKSGVSVSGESGSRGVNGYGYSSCNSESVYLFGSGSYRRHRNYSDGSGGEIGGSGFNDAEGSVNFGFRPAERQSVEVRTQYYEGWDIGIPGARDFVPSTASGAEYTGIRRALLSVDYKIFPLAQFFTESRIHLYGQYIGRDVKIENAGVRIEPEADHKTAGAQWTNILTYRGAGLVLGADSWIRTIHTERRRTSIATGTLIAEDTPVPDAYYLSSGIFTEGEVKSGALALTAGGRFDSIITSNDTSYSSTGSVLWNGNKTGEHSWNGHAGGAYMLTDGFTMSILAASSYRAASLEERYKYILLAGSVEHWGNPDLKPERSYFFEYAIHLRRSVIKSDASVYLNMLRDLIADSQVSSTEWRLKNISRARIIGAEYNIALRVFDRLELHNDLTVISGRDTDSGDYLPSIAPFRTVTGAKVNGMYGLGGFFDCVYTAAQNRVPAGGSRSESWTRLDAGISWSMQRGDYSQRIYITCVNILDKTYYDYLTMSSKGYVFNEPGRSFKCGYNASL